jgi:FkbM family methyltransferase
MIQVMRAELMTGVIELLLRLRNAGQLTALRKLRAVLVDDPVVRIDEFEGVFGLDVRGHLFERVLLQGRYEPTIVRHVLSHVVPDGDAIDVGAAVGFYSVLIAKHLTTGRVLAIEPIPQSLKRLQGNLTRNEVDSKVIVFGGAASNTRTPTQVKFIHGLEEYSSMGEICHPAVRGHQYSEVTAKSSTVDFLVDLHGLKPRFIKIDVEGMEHKVLEGARATIARFRPVIYSELSDFLLKRNGASAHQVVSFLRQCGYRIVDPIRPNRRIGRVRFGDILCLPEG